MVTKVTQAIVQQSTDTDLSIPLADQSNNSIDQRLKKMMK